MKKANLSLDGNSTGMSLVERMEFEQVDAVFDALNYAFYPTGIDENNFDDRHHALWTLFLSTAGWTEEEFWEAVEEHAPACPDCGEPMGKTGHHEEADDDLLLNNGPIASPNGGQSKPN